MYLNATITARILSSLINLYIKQYPIILGPPNCQKNMYIHLIDTTVKSTWQSSCHLCQNASTQKNDTDGNAMRLPRHNQ